MSEREPGIDAAAIVDEVVDGDLMLRLLAAKVDEFEPTKAIDPSGVL